MRRLLLLLLAIVVGGGVGGLIWWHNYQTANTHELILYGNVDLRQIQLAFNNNERIARVLVEEGDTVYEGQVLAELDKGRLQPQVDDMAAQADAERQAYLEQKNGSRPQEVIQAKNNVKSAKADVTNAREKYERLLKLAAVPLSDKTVVRASSQEEVDDARAAWVVAEAKLIVQQQQYDMVKIGPREEKIAQAKFRVDSIVAQLARLKQQLADAELRKPTDAVVRTRLMEPGEMSSPQRPVFSLAVIKKKWVRAYVSETDLGKVRPRMAAAVAVDGIDHRFTGQVGFISSVAEFTPKAVQTEELRTSLVYEVRVIVDDPNNELRLGMPATVHLNTEQ